MASIPAAISSRFSKPSARYAPSSTDVMSEGLLRQLDQLRAALIAAGEILPGGVLGDALPFADIGLGQFDHLGAGLLIDIADFLIVGLGVLHAEGFHLG